MTAQGSNKADSELEPITNKVARYGDGAIVYHNGEAVVPISVALEYVLHYKAIITKATARADREGQMAELTEQVSKIEPHTGSDDVRAMLYDRIAELSLLVEPLADTQDTTSPTASGNQSDNLNAGANMNDEQIKHMVNRFLGWKLPENFAPDAGISFDKSKALHGMPTGTNLFDATQAEAMIRYLVEGIDLATPDRTATTAPANPPSKVEPEQ